MNLIEIYPNAKWLHLINDRVSDVSEEDFLIEIEQHHPNLIIFSPEFRASFSRDATLQVLYDYGDAWLTDVICQIWPLK